MSSTTVPALELIEVTKRFRRGEVSALEGFSLRVPADRITFLVGPSGAGKSVLCRLAVGLLTPDAGEVRLFGVSLASSTERTRLELRARAPYVVQGSGLLDWLTLEENVRLALHARGPAVERRATAEALSALDLLPLAHRLPPEVSPATRKRAALARALALDPSFLLLDEPTTGLDRPSADQVSDAIESLRLRGLGALVVSHDYRAASRLADEIVVLSGGRMAFSGSRNDFFASRAPAVTQLLEPLRRERLQSPS